MHLTANKVDKQKDWIISLKIETSGTLKASKKIQQR